MIIVVCSRAYVAVGKNFEYFSIAAMLLKIVILSMEKWSHMDKFFNGDMLMKIIFL